MKETVLGRRFARGDKVVHRERPDIPGMVRLQHINRTDHKPIAQYHVEWERSPFGYGKARVEHVWESDLRHAEK